MLAPVQEYSIHIAVVTPQGRLDALSATELWTQLSQLLADGTHHLVIDMTAVTFCDSAAIAVLVRALKHARAHDGSVRLVWPESLPARRIFTLTRFDQVFAMAESVEEALAGWGNVA